MLSALCLISLTSPVLVAALFMFVNVFMSFFFPDVSCYVILLSRTETKSRFLSPLVLVMCSVATQTWHWRARGLQMQGPTLSLFEWRPSGATMSRVVVALYNEKQRSLPFHGWYVL